MINFNVRDLIDICPDKNAAISVVYDTTEVRIEWLLTSKHGIDCGFSLCIKARDCNREFGAEGELAEMKNQMRLAYENLGVGNEQSY